jgi:hypothetical protein
MNSCKEGYNHEPWKGRRTHCFLDLGILSTVCPMPPES